MPAATRRGRALAAALALDDHLPLYLTQSGAAARTQRRISSTAYTALKAPVVFVCGDGQQAWIQNVRLARDGDEYVGLRSVSTPTHVPVNVSIGCSVDNCIGCIPNTAQQAPTAALLRLQSKCMAAQQCAIARCVGTTVNMRKPLCNIGKVRFVRWDFINTLEIIARILREVVCLFVCLFVCWYKTRNTILRSLCLEGSNNPWE